MNLLGANAKPADVKPSRLKRGRNFDLGQAEYVAIKRGSALKALHDQTTMLYLTELHVSLLTVLSIISCYCSTNPEKSTVLSDQSFAWMESKSLCCGFWLASFHVFCQRVRRVCILTSSAAVSGSVSAAVHSMKCLASSSKLDTIFGSLDFLAEDEMRPSVAASPPRRRGSGSRKKRSRSFSLLSLSTFTSLDEYCLQAIL